MLYLAASLPHEERAGADPCLEKRGSNTLSAASPSPPREKISEWFHLPVLTCGLCLLGVCRVHAGICSRSLAKDHCLNL